MTANEIAQADNLPVRNINNLLSRLTEVKILCKVMPENELEEVRYQPAMDINKITVGLVISYIEQQGEAEFFTNLPEPMNAFWILPFPPESLQPFYRKDIRRSPT